MEENSPDAVIISLQFRDISTQKTFLVAASKNVEIKIPYGVSVKSLTPIIEITAGASIVPASKTAQDFSQPVYYVLTSAEGKKTTYKVSVITLKQPIPEITSIDKSEIEAGESIVVKGKYFGNYQGAIQAYLVNAKNEEELVPSKLIDSTQIQLNIPKITAPQSYAIKVKVNSNTVVSNNKVNIQYPSPEITQISKKNILQNDTLFFTGNFVGENYAYKIILSGSKNQYQSFVSKNQQGVLFAVLTDKIPAGNYTVQILNESIIKKSKSESYALRLYDVKMPYLKGFIGSKTSYMGGDKISFKTQNFDNFPARFFQIQLSNEKEVVFQNGIYAKSSNTLLLDLPANFKMGNYHIIVTLINITNQEYSIELDEFLVIK